MSHCADLMRASASLKQQRYAHARQFKRAKRSLKTLKTFLGRVIPDVLRRIKGNEALEKLFAHPLMLARRVHAQNKNLRRRKGAPGAPIALLIAAQAALRRKSVRNAHGDLAGSGQLPEGGNFGHTIGVPLEPPGTEAVLSTA